MFALLAVLLTVGCAVTQDGNEPETAASRPSEFSQDLAARKVATANEHLAVGEPDKAMAAFLEALVNWPVSPEAWQGLQTAAERAGDAGTQEVASFFLGRLEWIDEYHPRVVASGFQNAAEGYGSVARGNERIRKYATLTADFVRHRYERELVAAPKAPAFGLKQLPAVIVSGALGVSIFSAMFSISQ